MSGSTSSEANYVDELIDQLSQARGEHPLLEPSRKMMAHLRKQIDELSNVPAAQHWRERFEETDRKHRQLIKRKRLVDKRYEGLRRKHRAETGSLKARIERVVGEEEVSELRRLLAELRGKNRSLRLERRNWLLAQEQVK